MGFFRFFKSQTMIDLIEWKESSAHSLVYRFPSDHRPISMGAQLIVRESQCAAIVAGGKVADVFGPGRYSLTMETMPELTVIHGWKHGHQSPFEADVYFVNMKQFSDQKWSAVAPITVKDAEYGAYKLKASGSCTWKVSDAERFMKDIFGGNQIYDTAFLIGQLKSFLVSGLSDMLTEAEISADELTERMEELGERTENRLQNRFARMGLELSSFLIEEWVLPDEIISEIEQRARRKAQEEEEARRKAEEEEAERQKAMEEAAAGDEDVPVCAGCGFELEPIMKFCPECGAKV